METIRSCFRLVSKNFFSLIFFDVIYKLLCAAVFIPLLTGLFNLSLLLSGYQYLSEGRLPFYLFRPTTILILLFLLFCLTLVASFEIAAIIYCFHASHFHVHISVTAMFRHGFEFMKSLVKRCSPLFILFVMVIIPLTNLTVVSGYVTTFKIPDFIMYTVRSYPVLLFLTGAIFFLLLFLSVRWCYSIHSFVLDGCSYTQARKKSRELIKYRGAKTLGVIFLWNVIIFLSLLLLSFLFCVAYTMIQKGFLPEQFWFATVLSTFSETIRSVFSVYSLFSITFSYALLCTCYYQECHRLGISLPNLSHPKPLFHRKTSYIILASAVFAAGAINLFYFGFSSNLNFFRKQNIISNTMVTAHRGDSFRAPENTIASFQSAIDAGADCIELDVAQTKDGVIVVTHDSNLKRITGKNINIWDITYEDLKKLDAGSWFGSSYANETIPSLAETLEFCKGKIPLNIELKPTGHEKEYEAGVLSVIEEYRFEYDCIIASKSATSLKKMKELNPNITTIYLMTVAYGNLAEMDFADGFSIESSFISASLVSHIHDAGKSIYAWTVNDESGMDRMFRLGVDSLVTDDTIKAKETYYSQNLNETILSHFRNMFPSMP